MEDIAESWIDLFTKQDGRLPSAYLRLPNLVKMQFWKMKTFFPRKNNTFSSSYFQILPKNLITREKTFLRKNTIWYAFYSKFATFMDFGKKINFFPKPQILNALKILAISVAFYGKFAANRLKKIDIQTREQPMLARLRELNWQTSGKKSAPIWEEDFAFHIFNMAQNKLFSNLLFAHSNSFIRINLF